LKETLNPARDLTVELRQGVFGPAFFVA
jgi:hypothetical protein